MMNVHEQNRHCCYVILSEAKDLRGERIVYQRRRSFASLRMSCGMFTGLERTIS